VIVSLTVSIARMRFEPRGGDDHLAHVLVRLAAAGQAGVAALRDDGMPRSAQIRTMPRLSAVDCGLQHQGTRPTQLSRQLVQ
jgi:hypothetical protein